MQIIIKGKNIEVTDSLRRYSEEKIGKITKFFSDFINADVELIEEKNPSIANPNRVEVTIYTKGSVIRAKVADMDMYAAIDSVAEKIEKQAKRFKSKLRHKNEHGSIKLLPLEGGEEERGPMVVKTKQFSMKPMSPEEASLQMELLGHDFFVFTNSETDQMNVVYRRKDGNYGLIEPRR